jgi:hypothetical protein
MKPTTMRPVDEVGQFISDQTPPVELALASPACRHSPLRSSETGIQASNFGCIYDDECLQHTPINWNFGKTRRIPPHDDLVDLNAPVIDSGHPIRVHDRIRKKPGLFERVVARLKFWPDPDPYGIPEYLRQQKD